MLMGMTIPSDSFPDIYPNGAAYYHIGVRSALLVCKGGLW